MKIRYRKPTLIEQMTDAVVTATKPIECFELSQSEFQSVYNNLDKTKNKTTVEYSYKGIPIKVINE